MLDFQNFAAQGVFEIVWMRQDGSRPRGVFMTTFASYSFWYSKSCYEKIHVSRVGSIPFMSQYLQKQSELI